MKLILGSGRERERRVLAHRYLHARVRPSEELKDERKRKKEMGRSTQAEASGEILENVMLQKP